MTSGQVPLRDGELLAQGKVGDDVEPDAAVEAAAAAALNGLAAARRIVQLEDLAACISLRVFVASLPDFTDIVPVADGASAVLAAAFPHTPLPARTAVGVCSLPLNAPVEVELTLLCADDR